MPRYEYRCRDCEHTFELTRSMAQSSDPAPCPFGHADTVKLLSTVSVTGTGRSAAPARATAAAAPMGGGCCGGGCH